MSRVLDNINIGECSICYRDLLLNQDHILTICGHLFCVKCLFHWYNLSNACPVCRANLSELENEDNNLENIHQVDDFDSDSIYTGDSDDGRFDTIDDFLHDDYTWTGIVVEDDLKIETINPEVINQLSITRQNIIKLHRYDLYKMCTLLPKQFNGNIIQNIINRDKYLDFTSISMQSSMISGYNYIYTEIGPTYHQEDIYEIVLKNTDNPTTEVHYFCRIRGRTMVNNHFIQNYNDGTSLDRCSLEYAFVVDIFSLNMVKDDELVIQTEKEKIMFKDIRRLYKISPMFELENEM
jgi:hypothetical protein